MKKKTHARENIKKKIRAKRKAKKKIHAKGKSNCDLNDLVSFYNQLNVYSDF